MVSAEDRIARLMLAFVPLTIFVCGCGLSLLPHRTVVAILNVVVDWLTLSVSVAVLFGHCVPEDPDPL